MVFWVLLLSCGGTDCEKLGADECGDFEDICSHISARPVTASCVDMSTWAAPACGYRDQEACTAQLAYASDPEEPEACYMFTGCVPAGWQACSEADYPTCE
jgi:hypothetical protein